MVASPTKEGATSPKESLSPKKRNYDVTEHKLSVEELQPKVQTNIDLEDPRASFGLSEEEALLRLKRDGPNALRPPKATPEIVKFLKQFLSMFLVLLNVASVLCYICYGLDTNQHVNLYCGIALTVIVVVQATASYLQERSSDSVMASLKKMVPAACTVVRQGQPRRIAAQDLVVGDVVHLKGGDRVPADMRIIQTSGLKVECSSLTGESDAMVSTVDATHEEPHESHNIVFNTSQCTEGSAVGVVIRTGDKTLIGMVAVLATDTTTQVSTLQREISRVVNFITVLAFLMAVAILVIGLLQKVPPLTVVSLVISVFVANIPQGLPATVTSCLSIAATRMFRRNVLVKNLEVIETLGAATCIASDKTGTLTQNKMSVQNFWFNGEYEMLHGGVMVGGSTILEVPGAERRPSTGSSGSHGLHERRFVRWHANPLEPLLRIAAVCNSAKFAAEQDKEERDGGKDKLAPVAPAAGLLCKSEESAEAQQFAAGPADHRAARVAPPPTSTQEVLGDASEAALLRYCDAIYPIEQVRALYPIAFNQPFNSTNKYALCVVNLPPREADGQQVAFLKGAPEVVLERCSKWLSGGVEKPVDDDFRQQFQVAYERFAQAGERVLGFASQSLTKRPSSELTSDEVPTTDFVFMGLISLMDPPKLGVDRAVLQCHEAGIRVFMVTGDHALTAEAIARKVNIITLPTRGDLASERGVPLDEVDPTDPAIQAVVVTGSELRKYTEKQWEWLLPHKQIVFARTTPQQKLEIVQNLQSRGEIVAVTGDGVNDSPALKKADIGVAMGNPNASDVARQAADIIILDDDFCTIVHAIKEGRLLFDNLKKSIAYTLSHLWAEIMPVLLNIILLVPLGLSALLILSIDLGSELVPAICLAYEDTESAIMKRRPRNTKTDRLVTSSLLVYSYVIAGVLEAGCCVLAYCCVFWSYGIDVMDLLHTSTDHWSVPNDDFVSGRTVISVEQQQEILSEANGAWYATLILCQMFHLWFCRTRTTSVTQHPLLANKVALMAMAWELAFILIFCYIRQFQPIFTSGVGLHFKFWFISCIFLVCIAGWTEFIKYCSRKQLRGEKSRLAWFAW